MAWRAAPSVAAILSQATALWPARATFADGTIGDAAHAARTSDHNPDSRGIVHAADLTHDPDHGVDCAVLSEAIRARRDPRVKYVIFNRRIFDGGVWAWQPYDGLSPHTEHMHVSILSTTTAEDDVRPWYATTTEDDMTLDELKAALRTDRELRESIAGAVWEHGIPGAAGDPRFYPAQAVLATATRYADEARKK